MTASEPLFRRILGTRFDQLPVALQRVHESRTAGRFSGRCDIIRGESWAARILAYMAALPHPGDDVAIGVDIVCELGDETWTRRFGRNLMQSRLTERHGRLVERLGPVRLTFVLEIVEGTIVWTIVNAHVLGVRLPLSWFRKVTAKEAVEAGRYTFDVRAELPRVGLLIHYRGWLE